MQNYTATARPARVGAAVSVPLLVRRLLLVLLLALPGLAGAQAPTVTALSPTRNALAAARTTPVGVTFSQPIAPTTASTIRVYSTQAGGAQGWYLRHQRRGGHLHAHHGV